MVTIWVCVCVWKSLSHVWLFATQWTVCSPPGSSLHVDSSGKNTGVGFHTTPGGLLNPGMEARPQALQVDSLPFEPPGKPQQKWTM